MNQGTGLSVVRERHLIWRRLRPAPVVLLAALMLAAGASAQGKAKSSVAVLQLRVSVRGVSPDAGIAAARLISEAFASTKQYEVASSDAVEETIGERGFAPPFGVGHLQLLADVLGVNMVVHGSIRGLTFDPEAGSASVILAVELVDGKRGSLKGKHEAAGAYTAPEGGSGNQQTIIMGALTAGAEALVEKITGVRASVGESELAGGGEPGETALTPAAAPDADAGSEEPKSGVPMGDLVVTVEEPPSDPEPDPDTGDEPKPGDEGTDEAKVDPIVIVIKPDEEEKPPDPQPNPLPESEDDPFEDEFPPVNVKVLARTGDQHVLITLGRNGPIAKKMELEVYRVHVGRDGDVTKRRIGRIRVSRLNRTDAEARVLEGGALIGTGDLAYYEGL